MFIESAMTCRHGHGGSGGSSWKRGAKIGGPDFDFDPDAGGDSDAAWFNSGSARPINDRL